ncbi:Lrp/AsnC family transcriptional regulator [Fuscibacter oryzae]|uniref:Lrp/AsnC family transcriptional regulator n=1 Tax=Fuscibacter oryzae TaxID=2803939 RepID=A0A8J7SW08_9RHOB|nr:Lrp/AsnC family transcriptional regulator [Fuscibacter oryzae]MBL4930077.1 Lrp/AsnC family transcriptional regulator [Fuscibacter oryzae]
MQLDDSDRRILRALQEQPELTLRELGEVTGLSHSPCWRRLQRLQQEGAIGAKRFVVDPEAIGFDILVLCFVKISHHQRDRLRAFEEAVAKVPEVMQCYSLSGEYDYVLQVIATSVRDYEATVKNAIVELPNVQSVNTSFTLKRVKNSLNVPI